MSLLLCHDLDRVYGFDAGVGVRNQGSLAPAGRAILLVRANPTCYVL